MVGQDHLQGQVQHSDGSLVSPSPDHDYQGIQVLHSNLLEVMRPSPSPKILGVLAEEVNCGKWWEIQVVLHRVCLVQVVAPGVVVQPEWVPRVLP